ncbi:MAG: non-canonical purine NTP diphosphatase [Lachnoclostridium sp.]|nr:non-canonical purine NTP diphosphatase [Lachnoclostridium sp.]
MSSIVFATNNKHKLSELRAIVGDRMEIMSLDDICCHDDIPETGNTLRENALIKARWVKEHYGYDCFADDTGLMVDALDGAPGVYSARYAGPECIAADNVALLLDNLKDVDDRSARFMTVIALVEGEDTHFFEGVVEGTITRSCEGSGGFGYDPVFRPDGFDVTFACMSNEEKNSISHRGRATEKLIKYLFNKNI